MYCIQATSLNLLLSKAPITTLKSYKEKIIITKSRRSLKKIPKSITNNLQSKIEHRIGLLNLLIHHLCYIIISPCHDVGPAELF